MMQPWFSYRVIKVVSSKIKQSKNSEVNEWQQDKFCECTTEEAYENDINLLYSLPCKIAYVLTTDL